MERIVRFVIELEQHLWAATLALGRWRILEGELSPDRVAAVAKEPLPEVELPALWGGYDQTAWFFAEAMVPQEWRGRPVYLFVDVDESLLFVNGVPVQGIDRNHGEYRLSARAQGGERYALALESYSGLSSEKRLFRGAELRLLRPEAWRLYFDLRVALEVLSGLDPCSAQYSRLVGLLEETAHLLDPREPGSPGYFRSVRRAAASFAKEWSTLRADVPGRVWTVGHAHIDVAWLWRIKEAKRKSARTFATALALMDEYPRYHFVQSQPQLYAFVKAGYPELYRRIRAKAKEGQWEPTGGMWVEADCNIPSGESLVRQLLYGQRFLAQEFGAPARVLWLPDVFGYSWALPQLLRKAGIDYFFTAKIGWLYQNPFPHSTFWWEGVDGSRVLAHLCFHRQAYSAGLDAAAVRETWQTFRQKEGAQEVILSFGHGDGGGGPTREQLEHQRRVAHAPGLPTVRPGSLTSFFRAAEAHSPKIPVWADELYLEGHRGTYTTHAAIKRENRKCELLLRDAELLACLAERFGYIYPAEPLRQCWEKLLCNQFHDILPGSSIPEVYQDALADYVWVREVAGRERDRALQTICAAVDTSGAEQNLVVFNTLGWPRTDVVAVDASLLPRRFHLEDSYGRSVPHQVVHRVDGRVEVLFVAREVPPCGYTTFRVLPGMMTVREEQCRARGDLIETPRFKAQMNAKGELLWLEDRANGVQVLAAKEPGNVLQTFLDYPRFWEAWEIDQDFEAYPLHLLRVKRELKVTAGPVCAVARAQLTTGRSTLVQDILFYGDLGRIDFDTLVDWHDPRTLLKVAFPTSVRAEQATFEIQFGAIARSTRRNNSWDSARFEVPAQRWADLSDGRFGVSLLNDCKYGHDVHEDVLRLTLLKNCYAPDPVSCQYGVLYRGQTDEGLHRFVYALWPHPGDWRAGRTVHAAYELNVPLVPVLQGQHSGPLPAEKSFVTIGGAPSVVLDTIKRAEDDHSLVLRIYESSGHRALAQVSAALEVEQAAIADLLEREQKKLPWQKGSAQLVLHPFEVVTLKLR
ncbi:MAG: alpha-mannosidase [Candidatus Oleimicrobiaceae bacterium]